jgi:hypothetical protein
MEERRSSILQGRQIYRIDVKSFTRWRLDIAAQTIHSTSELGWRPSRLS